MHSRRNARRRIAFLGCASVWLTATSAAFAQTTTRDEPIASEEIAAAIEQVKADPNLAQSRKSRTLRWAAEDKKPPQSGGIATWIADFFRWFDQLSRALMWVLGGLLALALVWRTMRFFRHVGGSPRQAPQLAPTHVHDLDIRPESLPDDIGAAARELWDGGEHRAAIALLYRGMLSRLAHVHAVPIRDSSTEGDCLMLAKQRLPEREVYIATLIRVRQSVTYGAHDPSTEDVHGLCRDFSQALAAAAASTHA